MKKTKNRELASCKLKDLFINNKSEEIIKEYIFQNAKKLNIDYLDGLGNSFLILASNRGYTEVVKLLVELGGDVNTESYYGNIALKHLIIDGKVDCVSFLLENGAILDKVNNGAEPYLRCAVRNRNLDMSKFIIEYLFQNENSYENLSKLKETILFEETEQNTKGIKYYDEKENYFSLIKDIIERFILKSKLDANLNRFKKATNKIKV